MELKMEPIRDPTVDGTGDNDTTSTNAAPSLGRPPLLHNSHTRSSSARTPTTPAFRGRTLSIDVNTSDSVPPVAMASPLALFSTRKLQTTAPAALSVAETASDHPSLPHHSGSPFLEYGMIVSLVCDDRNGIVCAEGFASRDVRLEKLTYSGDSIQGTAETVMASVSKLGLGGREERRLFEEAGVRLLQSPFRDCLFEIVPKMAYDATAALEEVTAAQSRDKRTFYHGQHSLADLKFKSDAETRLNAMMYRKLRCSQVIYGQTVQFRHIKTGLFLCLDAAPLPLRGGEHSKVSLDKGSWRAHFSILPRFKLRSKGAPVQLTDQLILNSGSEEQVSSLYASSRQLSDGLSCAVVGSSVHSSQWRAILFERADELSLDATVNSSSGVRAGDCIRLLHLESASLLHCGADRPREGSSVSLQFREDSQEEDTVEDESEVGCLSSDSLWMVERAVTYEGGQVQWKESICLRHILTGKYLAVHQFSSSPASIVRSPVSQRAIPVTMGHVTASDVPDPFVFIPTAVTSSNQQVGSNAITLLQHSRSKTFVHSPETHASTMTDIRISSKALRDGEHNGSAFSVTALPGARDEDAFRIIPVPQVEIDDTLLLFSYKRVLRQFVIQFEATVGETTHSESESFFDREEKLAAILQAEHAISDLLEFCSQGIKHSQCLHRLRQSMFRSHQFVDLLMDMIKAPFDRFGGPFSIDSVSSHNPSFKKQSRSENDPDADLLDDEVEVPSTGSRLSDETKPQRPMETSMKSSVRNAREGSGSRAAIAPSTEDMQVQVMRALNRIIPAVNSLLVQIFCGHRANEVYVAQRAMPILMELLGNGFQTSLPLSYLLRENRNLVESITAYSSIIRNFFELIKTRGRSIRYMQFLVALCTSRGRGVPKTQESICELMFNASNGYRDFVIVPMRANSNGFEVYVGSRRIDGGRQGAWISLNSLYQDYYVHGKHRGLGQYCYGLLQLYVVLCLDRNYVSIDYVQQTFPRESLLKAVKDTMLARSLRAVLLDLIRVAYVDCEPQKAVGCPRFTRIWTEIGKKGDEVKLPSFSTDGYSLTDLAFFSQVKDMCLAYFVNLHGQIVLEAIPENQLLLAMLKVCKKMVEFGMYASHTDLCALVASLVDLLDERSDIVAESSPSAPDCSDREASGQARVHRWWFGENKNSTMDNTAEARRARELSVTDGIENLFTTLMVNDSGSSARKNPDQGIGTPRIGDTEAPLLWRLRNCALLDGTPQSSGTAREHERSIARQYGVGSLIWNQHCGVRTASMIGASRIHAQGLDGRLLEFDCHAQGNADGSAKGLAHQHRRAIISPLVMEIKDEICAILQLVDSIRLDYQVSMFLAAFRTQHGDTEAVDIQGHASFDDDQVEEDDGLIDRPIGDRRLESDRTSRSAGSAFAEKSSPVARFLFDTRSMECKFSLSQLSKRNVNTVLMQMLMCEYPPLVSKSLELLLQQFNQHDQLLSSLQNLQLLVAEETIAIYNRLKDDVNDLRKLSETTEVWMDLTSKSDFENAEWACSLLRTIRFAITKHTAPTTASENSGNSALKTLGPGGSSRHASAAHFQRRMSSGVLLKVEDADGSSSVSEDFLQSSAPAPQVSGEKSPPNRKKRLAANVYMLNPHLGKVSCHSSCHELLPMAKSHHAELQPMRKVRSHSVVMSMVAEARRLLRNLRAAQYVISMMEDGAHFYEAHTQDTQRQDAVSSSDSKATFLQRHRQHSHMRGVFEEALQFLCAFCTADPENQSILGPHAAMIVQYVGDLETAQQVLVAMYTSNLQMCKTVPTEVVNSFVSRLVEDPSNPRYLFFLETIVLCDETPIHENQLLVLFQLVKCLDSGAILQYFDDPVATVSLFTPLFRRYARTLQGQANSPQKEHTDDVDDQNDSQRLRHRQDGNVVIEQDSKLLEYHVRLLHLFSACATGKNTRCQEICHQIIPLRVALELLRLEYCSTGVQFALLRFLREVYLTAEDVEIRHDDQLSHVFEQLIRLCEQTVHNHLAALHDEDVNRLATAALQKSKRLRDSLLSTSETKGKGPVESRELYLLVFSVIPTIASFISQLPQFVSTSAPSSMLSDSADNHNLGSLADALTSLFAVSALGEWSLPEEVMEAADELCTTLDKLLPTERRADNSLSVMWLNALSRNKRPDLSRLTLSSNTTEMALILADLDEVAKDIPVATGNLRESGQHGSSDRGAPPGLPPTHRARRMRSKQASSAASDNGVAHHFSDSQLPPAKATHAQLEKLHVVQPLISGRGGVYEQGTGKRNTRRSSGNEGSDRRDSYSKLKGPLGASLHTTTSALSLPQSVLRRLGLQSEGTQRLSVYSRHSALSIQCTSTGKVNSSLFKNYQQQAAVRKQGGNSSHQRFEAFDHFLWRLCSDSRVENAMREELNHMVDSILSVESSLLDEFDAKIHSSNIRLTFDQVVTKLVAHVQAFKDAHYVKTNLILLDVFCRMIYATEGDWERRHAMQIKLNQLKVTKLVVHLIASRDDDAIFERSIELGVALLDGMNAEVQESFHKHWLEVSNGSAFCSRIQARIEKACRLIHNSYGDRSSNPVVVGSTNRSNGSKPHHSAKVPDKNIARLAKRRSVMYMDTSEPIPLAQPTAHTSSQAEERNAASLKVVGGPMALIFRFLQLLCEGHYLNAQRFLIAQPAASQPPVNLVETTTSFLLETYLALADLDVGLIIQLFDTITEFCQGPCIEAQNTVANFKFFSTANALLMHHFLDHSNPTELFLVRRLRASVVITLLSLLEGRSDRVIHTQLVQELNFDALKDNLIEVFGHFQSEYGGKYAGNVKCSDDFYLEMGFNIYFLLQQLADSFPSSATSWIPRANGERYRETADAKANEGHSDYLEAFTFFQSNSARVEVVWNHERDGGVGAPSNGGARKISRAHGPMASGINPDEDEEGRLMAYYFPLHPICYCLTEQSKKKLVWHVARGASKLNDFYSRSDKLVDEMAHQSRLQHHRTLAVFARSADLLKRISFILAVVINLLVLMYYQADGIESKPYAASRITFLAPLDDINSDPASAARIGLSLAGTVQLELCVLILLCYLVNSAPLLIKKGWKRRIRSEQDRLSKKKASVHHRASDTQDKETFQDTEQLLRSLRDREEEYDYLFLPRRQHTRHQVQSIVTNSSDRRDDDEGQVRSYRRNSAVSQARVPASAWERLWRFLFGPASIIFRSAAARGPEVERPSSSASRDTDAVTTVSYLRTVAISLYFLIRSPRVLYYMWQICIAILGSYVNNLFFAFHLLDVVNRYQELSNVLRSIVRPAKVLGVTLLLYLVVVYVFAIVGFYFFREDYNPSAPLTESQRAGTEAYQCQRLFQCFLIGLDQGFKSDGGLGGYLKYRVIGATPGSYARLLFDMLYNMILLIMLLNIVFGVIIDTFASLREADHEKLMDMQNRCFICSIDAYTFDRATKRGFHEHIYSEHNMWHYLYLFVHIRKKPITEYNGLELYLAMRMAKRDVSFFPSHRALSLEKASERREDHVYNNASLFTDDASDGGGESALRHRIHDVGRRNEKFSSLSPSSQPVKEGRRAAVIETHQRSPSRVERKGSRSDPVASKLDKLESTIQYLLNAQVDLKEQHARSLQRQNELLEMLVAMNNPRSASSAGAVVAQAIGSQAASSQAPTVASGQQTRRTTLGIVHRSPSNAAASGASEMPATQLSGRVGGRRAYQQPRVFNFDSVVEESPQS